MFASRVLLLLSGLTSVLANPMHKRAEEGKVLFGYEGNTGPNLWPGFCQDIQPGQSPIDIRAGSADANPGTLQADLQPVKGATLRNTGHSLDVELPEGGAASTFVAAGQRETFRIKGFHFHTPSEHRFNGTYFDGEVHFVSESPSGVTAVMAVMLEVSEQPMPNNLLTVVHDEMPHLIRGQETVEIPPFDFSSVLAATDNLTGFHTYTGSLTTPPCSTNVLWHVFDKPMRIGVREFLALRRAQGFNSRFVQVARDEQPVFTEPEK